VRKFKKSVKKVTKYDLQLWDMIVIFRRSLTTSIRDHGSSWLSFTQVRQGGFRMHLSIFEPHVANSEARDETVSLLIPDRACVVTTGIGVVDSPCDKIRTEPGFPVRRSGTIQSRGRRHISSPEEKDTRSREMSRLTHPFQEEMMHMTQGWTGLRTAVVALGLLVLAAPGVKADGLLGYTTTGSPATSDIMYVPVSNVQVDPNSNLPLGSFQVSALAAGQTTTYDNTPFTITLTPTSFDGSALPSGTPSVTLSGVLNGTLTGASQSSVEATFTSVSAGGFTFLGASSTLSSIVGTSLFLVPASGGGITTIETHLTTSGTPSETPAPEPSTIALFLSTFSGLGLRRYVLRRRTQAAA
jgi:hypothetical protein